MAGRPRALCETKQGEICALVSTGCTIAAAARYVGCSTLTIEREARRNRQFHERLRSCRVFAQLSPIRTMRDAAGSEWRAAAWLLERTQPQHYAKRPPDCVSREEMVELLGRVCDVVRQETRDAQKFARIKRRVLALAQKSIRPAVRTDVRNDNDINACRDDLASPPSPSTAKPLHTEPTLPSHTAALSPHAAIHEAAVPPAAPSQAAVAPSTDQNVTNKDLIMICLADVPPGKSRGFAQVQASK